MATGSSLPFRHLAWTFLGLAMLAVPAAAQTGAEQPAPAVVVERITVQPVRNPDVFSARVEAIEAVDIRARVQGFLETVAFDAGQVVRAGDLLLEIEPARYEAAVASARAQVSGAEATRTQTERQLARAEELRAGNVAAQVTVDDARAAYESAVAAVGTASAALTGAELDLSYTRIEAPIAGVIGRSMYSVGNLVGPESGVLARIVQLDPVRVVFSVPEGLLVTVRQEMSSGGSFDPDALQLRLRLPNGEEYQEEGAIEYAASEVDPATGTTPIRAVFPNPDRLLVPGQFVTLMVGEEDVPELPVVPQTAVLQDREGRYVFLLGADNVVSQRRIETGARVGSGWAVSEGLEGGEPVVVQGIQRLAEGMTVQPSQAEPAGNSP
jgi:membrane fusion protein, multidrug efflux system